MGESAAAHHMINLELLTNSPGTQDTTSTVGTAAGRSYDCTFCKRGFSTAQALGGHMNIHRKDRAELRQAAAPLILSSITEIERNAKMHIPYWPYHDSTTLPRFSLYSPPAKNTYTLRFPVAASLSRDRISLAGAARREHPTSPFIASRKLSELRLFSDIQHGQELLQLQGLRVRGGGHGTSGQKMEKRKREEEEGGLDLELRLGAN